MGFFDRIKATPKAEQHFNHAMDIYRQLRRYPEHSNQYRQQLTDIASSCRLAIQLNDRHGDAHVLLANTYWLMFIDGYPRAGDLLPLTLAAAVIQHWADTPMRQYPWTKNVDNGKTIYSQVSTAVRSHLPAQGDRSTLQQLEARHYAGAVSQDLIQQP